MIESYYGWTAEMLYSVNAAVAVFCVIGFSIAAYLIVKEKKENG